MILTAIGNILGIATYLVRYLAPAATVVGLVFVGREIRKVRPAVTIAGVTMYNDGRDGPAISVRG